MRQTDDRLLESIEEEMRILNDEMGSLRDRVARVETDVAWIKWLTMGIAGGTIALILQVIIVR